MITNTKNIETIVWGYYFLRENTEVSFVPNLILTNNNFESGILQMNIIK